MTLRVKMTMADSHRQPSKFCLKKISMFIILKTDCFQLEFLYKRKHALSWRVTVPLTHYLLGGRNNWYFTQGQNQNKWRKECLDLSTTSSSVSNTRTDATEPNISSFTAFISSLQLVSTAGDRNHPSLQSPSRRTRSPPYSSLAPSDTADLI